MMAAGGSLQKLLHLANAREALASGDFFQALSEADAAVAVDATFAAAQALRREIVARMSAAPQPVSQAPRVVEPLPMPAVVPPQPQRRTRSPWPARGRACAAAAALFFISVVAVMLVRSGGRGTDVRVPSLLAAPPSASTDISLPADVGTAPKVALTQVPKTKPVQSADSATPDVEATGWASVRLARLHVRPRWRVSAMHVDDAALLKDLGEGISELWVGKLTGNEDAIFIGGSLDENDWATLRASIKPTGVVWRIYPDRSGPLPDPSLVSAVAAGFARGRQVRYSSGYVAEQFTPRARPLLRPARDQRATKQ